MKTLEAIELLEGTWVTLAPHHYRRTLLEDEEATIEVYLKPAPGSATRWIVSYSWLSGKSSHFDLSGALTEANGLCRSIESSIEMPTLKLKSEVEEI